MMTSWHENALSVTEWPSLEKPSVIGGPPHPHKGLVIGSSFIRCRLGINTLRPRQNGRHFADDIFKSIFLNENVWIRIKISMKFVPKGPINNIQVLVQIMAWRRPGDKPLSEPMMAILMTHICATRPQWIISHGPVIPMRFLEFSVFFFFTWILLILRLCPG